MRLWNSPDGYGLVAIAFHWLVAITVLSLFALGLWMTSLTYYDPWYNRAPFIHKAVGILVFIVVLTRIVWRWLNPKPPLPPGIPRWERLAAAIVQGAMMALLVAVPIAGYLVATADGRTVDVFGLFEVPAVITGVRNMEDIAGDVHYWLAMTLIVLAGLHATAALKHHFMDRNTVLIRMLRPVNGRSGHQQRREISL